MRFLVEMILSVLLEGSQYEKMPRWIRVLGLAVLTVVVAISVFALSFVLLQAEQGILRRLIVLALLLLILWYYIGVWKAFLRHPKK